MNDSSWQTREPWIVVDPDFKREWLLPQPLRYFVSFNKHTDKWSICDRTMDVPVAGVEEGTRAQVIRRFYKWCKREMPSGREIPPPFGGPPDCR